jgi:hypothetical protein
VVCGGGWEQTAYHVYHSNAESHIQIDQSLSDEWQSLGVFNFHEGMGQRVAVFDHTNVMVEENQHIIRCDQNS